MRENAANVERYKKRADILAGALSKYKQKKDITVYRKISRSVFRDMVNDGNYFKSSDEITVESINALASQGAVIKDKGFMSASVTPNLMWSGDIVLQIFAPAGSNGAPVMGVSANQGENEYLFNRNTKMVITGARQDDDASKIRVLCSIIPENTQGEEREE